MTQKFLWGGGVLCSREFGLCCFLFLTFEQSLLLFWIVRELREVNLNAAAFCNEALIIKPAQTTCFVGILPKKSYDALKRYQFACKILVFHT